MPPAPVVTARVEEGSFIQPIQLTGTVEALRFTTISAEQSGVLERLLVDEGDRVTTGQLLLELRKMPLALEVTRARAEYRAEQARLDELEAGTREEDIAQRRAEIRQTEAELRSARRDLERYRQLLEEGSVSEEEFDAVQSLYETLEATLESRQAALRRAERGPREEEILRARADVDAKLAEAQLAADDLERASVEAPYSGFVTSKRKDIGGWVNRGEPLLDIEDISTVRVRIDVPEVYFNRFAPGDQLNISFDAAPKKKFIGTVHQVIPRADSRSRAFPVLIDIENEEYFLAPGMMARVMLRPLSEAEQTTVIPKDAIVAQGPVPMVYRVQQTDSGPVAEQLEIQTGRYFGEAVEVFGDLAPGDQVVIRGNERLQPGQKVNVSNFLPLPRMIGNEDINPGRAGE